MPAAPLPRLIEGLNISALPENFLDGCVNLVSMCVSLLPCFSSQPSGFLMSRQPRGVLPPAICRRKLFVGAHNAVSKKICYLIENWIESPAPNTCACMYSSTPYCRWQGRTLRSWHRLIAAIPTMANAPSTRVSVMNTSWHAPVPCHWMFRPLPGS